MATVLRELDHCIFCGDGDMTEEHLIADWAHRAFAKKRKPDGLLRMRIVGSGARFDGGDPEITAKVLCRHCNNNWVSAIDNAASAVLRPVIRGEREVDLDRTGQTAVAAWIYKTALIFDAARRSRPAEPATRRLLCRARRRSWLHHVRGASVAASQPPGRRSSDHRQSLDVRGSPDETEDASDGHRPQP